MDGNIIKCKHWSIVPSMMVSIIHSTMMSCIKGVLEGINMTAFFKKVTRLICIKVTMIYEIFSMFIIFLIHFRT